MITSWIPTATWDVTLTETWALPSGLTSSLACFFRTEPQPEVCSALEADEINFNFNQARPFLLDCMQCTHFSSFAPTSSRRFVPHLFYPFTPSHHSHHVDISFRSLDVCASS